eukprot:323256-Pleurochrysis_carterae.AAC.1
MNLHMRSCAQCWPMPPARPWYIEGAGRSTSARLWLNRAVWSSSGVICVPRVGSWLPCVTTAGDAAILALARGTTRTPMLSMGTMSPVGRMSEAWPVVAFTRNST